MRRVSDYLGAAYVVSGLAGLFCMGALALGFVLPGLTLAAAVAVPGLIIAASLTIAFRFAAIIAFRAEGRHG